VGFGGCLADFGLCPLRNGLFSGIIYRIINKRIMEGMFNENRVVRETTLPGSWDDAIDADRARQESEKSDDVVVKKNPTAEAAEAVKTEIATPEVAKKTAKEDREALKKSIELDAAEMTELIVKVTPLFSKEKMVNFYAKGGVESARILIESRVEKYLTENEAKFSDTSFKEFLDQQAERKALAIKYADRVLPEVESAFKAEGKKGSFKEGLAKIAEAKQTPFYSFHMKYDLSLRKFDVVFALDGMDSELTPEENEGLKELTGGKGKLIVFFLSMFGFIDAKAYKKDPKGELRKIVNAENYGANLVCGILGMGFGSEAVASLREAIPKSGEFIDKVRENKMVAGLNLDTEGIKSWAGKVYDDLKTAVGLKKGVVLKQDLALRSGKPMFIEVPTGKTAKIVADASGSLKVKNVKTDVYQDLSNGAVEITAGEEGLYEIEATQIASGSTFDEGVKLAWENIEVKDA